MVANWMIFCALALSLTQYCACDGEDSSSVNATSEFFVLIENNLSNCTQSTSSNAEVANLPIECESKSRRKRYIAFPEGSSFSVAFCTTVGFFGNPQYIYFSWGINWGVAYDLPNQTWILNQQNRRVLPKPIVQRRQRRELYENLEIVIDNMGYNGRACILRALCESAQIFYKRSTNMVEELVRTVFSLPSMKVLPFEHTDLAIYDKAHRKGRNKIPCSAKYPDCDLPLIELALGQIANSFTFV